MASVLLTLLVSANWLTMPSTYTHRDGVRVSQYRATPAPVKREPVEPTVYHYQRSLLWGPWSVDNYQRRIRRQPRR